MQNAFQVLSNEKSFTVFASSSEDCAAWICDINEAIIHQAQTKAGAYLTDLSHSLSLSLSLSL
jgi:hypothetical protein